jgi:hypothetical protein
MFLCYSYFSPLQVKKKTCDEVMKHAFILGPVFFVANNKNIKSRSCATANKKF